MQKNKNTRQITVIVALVVKNNKILLVKRNEPEVIDAHLKWEFPGGKVDFGETPEEAIVREIKEEAGVIAKVKRLIPEIFINNWDYPWGIQQTLILAYECVFIKEIERESDHHVDDAKWVDLKDIKKLERLPGVDFFVDKLGV